MDYHIYHLFPKLLNLYGDRGNITTLCFFARELGLNPIVHEIDNVVDINWDEVDFMLLGGGSDREQAQVTDQLEKIASQLKMAIDKGLAVLAVCGGYQFLGKYYQDQNGNKLMGLGIFDFYTIGQSKERLIGNTVVETEQFDKIIGFVNHAGETFGKVSPLGQVSQGYGNNLKSKDEGIFYHNLIGTYLHGPLLPRNPQLTLFFLEAFLKKNNRQYDLSKLDLSLETTAREQHLKRISE